MMQPFYSQVLIQPKRRHVSYRNVHTSFICNSQKVKQLKVSHEQMDNEIVVNS